LVSNITGDLGSVETYGDGKGGWSGYNINGQFAFLTNGTNWGIYNDLDNKWMIYGDRTHTNLMVNGISRVGTTTTGAFVEGTLQAGTVAATILQGYLDAGSLTGSLPTSILPSSIGTVGTYAFAAYMAPTGYLSTTTPGSDVLGSQLKWANSCVESGTVGWRNVTLTGTWRCMGDTGSYYNGSIYEVGTSINLRTTLWLRIA